jgi:hypothetical protein
MSSITTMHSREREHRESDVTFLDFRERRAAEALEQEAVKRQNQEQQYSTQNSVEARIRAWEKVHQLRMPSSPHHPVLEAIALATQLTLDDVRNEQQQRSARRPSTGT